MKLPSKSLAALATLIALTLSGCASLDQDARRAASNHGLSQAQLYLAELPEDCRKEEPHAQLLEGYEVRAVLKRERKALDQANSRVIRCSDFYDTVKQLAEDRT